GELQIPEFIPVDHIREQIETKAADDIFNIHDRELGIPAVIEMDGQRSQPELAGKIGDIGAVNAAAETHDTIIGKTLPRFLYLRSNGLEFLPALLTLVMPFLRLLILVIIITDPLLVKPDVR